MPGIVHHEIDEDRQQATEQRGAIPYLGAIDIAVPCRATMHQLVAQHIKPVEQDREYPGRVMIAPCGAYRCPRPLEPVSPVGIAGRTIVMLPKGMDDIAVCEPPTAFLREALPAHVVDAMFAIKDYKGCEEGLEPSRSEEH